VDSYKAKAEDEVKQAKKFTKSEYGDLAKRVIARRTKGLKKAQNRIDNAEYERRAFPSNDKALSMKYDSRFNESESLDEATKTHEVRLEFGHQEGDSAKYQVAAKTDAEATKKAIALHRAKWPSHKADMLSNNSYVTKLNESESLDEMGYGQARAGEHAWANSGSAMPAKYHVKDRATGKVISTHANAPDAAKARNKVGSADTHSIIKESSMSDLASGKGDGKELKASPEYRRDRRRTAQMLAAQKEVQARVKRGYAEDDKDLDESAKGHTMEAHGVKGMKNTPWRKTFKSSDHAVDWAEKNDAEIHGTRDLEQAKKGNLSPVVKEDLDEAKLVSPLKGHVYHTKSDAELRYIVKDAGEAAKAQKGMSSEGKYLDQMNDASTVLHYRSKGGKQITATNPRMVAPKSTDDSIKAKLAKWKKNESEEVDEGILSKLAGKIMGAAPKEPKYKVGQVVSYETPEDQPDWKDRGRGKGTITKYSNGHYIVNGNPVNHFDIKKVHESVDPDESSKGHTMEAHGVKGSIEEVSTARLKSYAEKAREDAEKLTKQGDRAKTDTTKLSKYVKATKRHLNAHKADDKISSNKFYGKK